MDSFLWWSGLAAWGGLGVIGLLWTLDQAMEWAIDGLWSKKEFLAFVAHRLKGTSLTRRH